MHPTHLFCGSPEILALSPMPSLVQLRCLKVCVGGVQTEVIVYLELRLQGLCLPHTYLALFLRPEALSSSWAVVSMCMAFAPASPQP